MAVAEQLQILDDDACERCKVNAPTRVVTPPDGGRARRVCEPCRNALVRLGDFREPRLRLVR